MFCLAVYNGQLYAGGDFLIGGTEGVLASWNGSAWQFVPGLGTGVVNALEVFGGRLIVGGYFNVASGHATPCLAKRPCACYANCDNSTVSPVLNVNDFACFLNRFAAGDPYANCDNSVTPPVLNVNDFARFLNAFAAGCP